MSMSPACGTAMVRPPTAWMSAPPGGAVTQIRLDPACRGKQGGQELTAHQVGASAAHRRRDVDRGDHPSGEVVDRRGDRPQAFLELLIDKGPALRSHQE